MQFIKNLIKKSTNRSSGRGEKKVGENEVWVSRAEFRSSSVKSQTESKIDLQTLVDQETDIGDVESSSVGEILWGNSKGYYALWVALSRFLAKYALDQSFREDFRSHPERYQIVLTNYKAKPQDLFVFDELGDRRVHPFPYGNNKDTAHFVMQRGRIDDEAPLHPDALRINLGLLKQKDSETLLRIGQILFIGGEQKSYDQFQSTILRAEKDEDSPNLLEALTIANSLSRIDPTKKEDILARRFAMIFVMKNDVTDFRFLHGEDKEPTKYAEAAKATFSDDAAFPEIRQDLVKSLLNEIRAELHADVGHEIRQSK